MALPLDHRFRRTGQEVLVGELLLEALHPCSEPVHLARHAGSLAFHVDDPLEGQEHLRAVAQDRTGARRVRRRRRLLHRGDPRQPPEHLLPPRQQLRAGAAGDVERDFGTLADPVLLAQPAHPDDQLAQPLEPRLGLRVGQPGRRHGPACHDERAVPVTGSGEHAPHLLRYEGDHGVKKPAHPVEDMDQDRAGGLAARTPRPQTVLDGFQIPVGEIAPEEVAQDLGGPVDAKRVELLVHAPHGVLLARQDPPVLEVQIVGHLRDRQDRFVSEAHQRKASGVPQLVDEVAPRGERGFQVLVVETDVGADPCTGDHREAQRVGPVQLDDLQRVDTVAEGLGHLAPLDITHGAVEVDAREGRLAHGVITRHDHAGHPEEEDFGGCGQGVAGVERLEVRGLVRPTEDRKGPQPRREPRIEHVRVLLQR